VAWLSVIVQWVILAEAQFGCQMQMPPPHAVGIVGGELAVLPEIVQPVMTGLPPLI